MRPNPQASDPFGRPDLATRTALIWASRTTATPGSVWPTRAGSDQAALDTQHRPVRDAALQALLFEHPNLNLYHVEPTGVLGGVVELQPTR